MAVPKRRTGKSRRDRRRANFKLARPAVSTCTNCGAAVAPHRVCAACGYYNGRLIIPVKSA